MASATSCTLFARTRSTPLLLGTGPASTSVSSSRQTKPLSLSMRGVRVTAADTSSTTTDAAINPSIKKEESKVVDTVLVSDLQKPLQAYCRCWRSGTFPLCDGTHAKHNKATGDNVGPLLLKK
ncbi:hypothetical protein KP509_15G074000 [Ceratopteris richardii]|uniref:Iron-binding zinc finger CDGSH type domain-containing protein n=1 Tax=Ceratopteris richardii TaxID=49495 RepID=A0A8T2T656_CERRI|nr:hypothetical protein KP509_15G074000 [Ceratopteris richardii]